ncbi:hypothetical protein SAMN05518672_11349 [Chitinophaga sp. CF118]|uniref:hypothetical protein n=1 Tax=Chitinophaga sp. CF118 TaxID=1884367 RepID=UPI0008ECECD5|nr:hypothetical protein [Chitinophaga sp. CF118]SFE96274.1 hypothetical protein SAMN05518672_11349 [Chitinophaga sp. CF118]
MKNCSLILSLAAVVLALGTACKKENHITDERALSAGPIHSCGDSTISGVITSNLFLDSCKVYKLSGLVYVANNATLTISKGALVQGIKGAPGGTLIITKGSKLVAAGTQFSPILFTSDQASPASGDWGGIVLLGKADINQGDSALVEGITGATPASAYYGGNDNGDNSGTLTYVRIEYAGYELAADNELNGLTIAGVGSNTTLNHIEVYKSKDDAFEFFGGTVNASYLIAVDALDDMFDFDNGFSGHISYALGISDPTRADKSQSNGIESDNRSNGDSSSFPTTKAVIDHLTIIGQSTAAAASITNGQPSGTGSYGRGAHFRRSSQFDVQNSIFLGFNKGISLDGALGNTPCAYARNLSTLTNNLVHAYVTHFIIEGTSACLTTLNFDALAQLRENYPYATWQEIGLSAPFNRPTTASAANYFPSAGSDAATAGAGAFTVGSADWAASWSRF